MEANNGDKIKIHERLATLESNIKGIMRNNLPHLKDQIEDLKQSMDKDIQELKVSVKSVGTKFWAVIILLIANLVGLVVSLYK